MAERRDNKNRILRKGEYQKADGRYMYKYNDINGKQRFVYSWTLTQTDRTPVGKKRGDCLRLLEKKISDDIKDEIDTYNSSKRTLNDLFDSYVNNICNIKPSTRMLTNNRYNKYIRKSLGIVVIKKINYNTLMKYYDDLLKVHKVTFSTVETIYGTINMILDYATRNNYLLKNPNRGLIDEIDIEIGVRKVSAVNALTNEEQNNFFNYVKRHPKYSKWYTLFLFLIETGCRISEAIALQWEDVDFDRDLIYINKTMAKGMNRQGKIQYYISRPKTSKGERVIPIFQNLKNALLQQLQRQKERDQKFEFCEYDNYVFTAPSKKNSVLTRQTVNYALNSIVRNYNKEEFKFSTLSKREPNYLPKITPHMFRHTFCTRLFESGIDVKTIQEIMGHESYETSLNVYTNSNTTKKRSLLENQKLLELLV